MKGNSVSVRLIFCLAAIIALAGFLPSSSRADDTPVPLVADGKAASWWFVFKFNVSTFPGCTAGAVRSCPFGGSVQNYKFSQQYAFASDKSPALKDGGGCAGDTSTDPVGATFDEIYTHQFFYVIWNDQFYGDPAITGCSDSCSGPWGHSKGMLVWNEAGEGLVMQVTTPSWPASGSSARPRRSDGNSLGCVEDDNVKVSQHFFSLRLNKQDILKVLMALDNASVVTDVRNHQIANIGGPEEIQQLAGNLGHKSDSVKFTRAALSSGVQLISKPSRLHLPPWQMVSAVLGGVSLRTATWWAAPKIYSTNRSTPIPCWDESLGKPGAISIATTGSWHGQSIGLTGGPGDNSNHAKIGVSTSGSHPYTIFGDMNQQGDNTGDRCASSQNGRGGLFFVVEDRALHDSVNGLLHGETAPTTPPE